MNREKWKTLVSHFSLKLGLSDKSQRNALYIICKLNKKGIYISKGMFGGALYIPSIFNDEKKSQEKVAKVMEISIMTLRKSFREILEKLNITDKIRVEPPTKKQQEARERQDQIEIKRYNELNKLTPEEKEYSKALDIVSRHTSNI